MTKKILAVALFCVFTLVTLGRAEDSRTTVLAEELLGVMNIQKNIEDSFAMVKQMIPAQMRQMGVPTGETSERTNKVLDLIMKEMTWDRLKADYVAIYASTFTAGELEGLVKFYKSPIGQKFIEKQPELMKRSMQISQKQMMQIMPKLQKLAAELKEKGSSEAQDAGNQE
jgi:hypothetical protein